MDFLPLIGVVLSSLIIYYVTSLEKIGCECAMGYKRTYILGYSVVAIIYGLFMSIVGADKVTRILLKNPLLLAFFGLLGVAGIVNMVLTFMFVEEMKKKNCDCSESVYRDMMYVLAILQAISIGLAALFGGYAGYMYVKTARLGPKLTAKEMNEMSKEINSFLKKHPKRK